MTAKRNPGAATEPARRAGAAARGARAPSRRLLLLGGAALALAACDRFQPPPPLPPSPVAAPGDPRAVMRVAQAEDVVGAWQMLALPPDVAQRVNVSPRFGEPYQWLLITADGRVGFVTTPEAPDPPITATSLRQMFDREPNFDAYTLAGGVMTVTTPGVVGFAAKRDVWHVDAVWTGGMLLGLAVRPGDLLMQLRDQTGRSIYQRVVRRIG